VLPVRIELTTSALPRMRSTTELRQHIGGRPGDQRRAYGQSGGSRQGALAVRGRRRLSVEAMTKSDPERERRLAEALRANLRRRKAQAREQVPEGEKAGEGETGEG
jgi:hypothetical protein